MIIVYTYVAKFQHDQGMDKPQPILLLFLLPPMMMADQRSKERCGEAEPCYELFQGLVGAPILWIIRLLLSAVAWMGGGGGCHS